MRPARALYLLLFGLLVKVAALKMLFVVLSVLVLMLIPLIVQSPDGLLAQCLSVVPFTAPAALLLRLPFGIAVWQVILAVVLLVLTFLMAATLAARVYRRHLVK
jgi:ABC-type Na+ efflux pump permease subunit